MYTIPYGEKTVKFELPAGIQAQVLEPKEAEPVPDLLKTVKEALENPIGLPAFPDFRNRGRGVIVISDITRPVPNRELLMGIFDKLAQQGIAKSQVTILVGTGLHRPASQEDLPVLIGPELAADPEVVVESHCFDREGETVYLGESSRKTPIYINRKFMEAGFRILTGMVEPHQFVGFTAGAKAITIGLGGKETVEGNHKFLHHPEAVMGNLDTNPARLDIDEIGGIAGADLIVNVVLNAKKKVAGVFAGHMFKAHREACDLAREICSVPADGPADIVIVSQGGFPKDVEMYQAQKSVAHAARVVKPGGTILLVAECREGTGSEKFEIAMMEASSPQDVMERFEKQGFRMGFHKAFLLARSMVKAEVILVSDKFPVDLAAAMKIPLETDFQAALDKSLRKHPGARVVIMPKGASTIPL